jgi:DNA-binding FadR family transcriptional regulator
MNCAEQGGTVSTTSENTPRLAPATPDHAESIGAPMPPGFDRDRPAAFSRAERAAALVTELIAAAEPGARLGTKEELRARCGVSVGTFNETLRLLHSRGLVSVRPGPGGGLFVAGQSPIVRLGNAVLALDTDQTTVAEAIRIRDVLEPLLVEDALRHASPADLAGLREHLGLMADAVAEEDAAAFKRANWRLHAHIAAISPNPLLRSLYAGLLDVVESHTIAVLPVSEQPLADYIAQRHRLHVELVDAIARQDRTEAMRLVDAHNTTTYRSDPA